MNRAFTELIVHNTRSTTLSHLKEYIELVLTTGGKAHIASLNPEIIIEAVHNPAFFAVLQNVQHTICDGTGVFIARKLLKPHDPWQKLTGVDMFEELVGWCAERGYRVGCVGGAHDVGQRVVTIFKSRYPDLAIVAIPVPIIAHELSPKEQQALAETIQKEQLQVCFFALGSPKQELLIDALLPKISGPMVMSGVGGAFNFVADNNRPAPWIRRMGMEWLARLIKEPWRWRRQVRLINFGVQTVWYAATHLGKKTV